ncbi:MAG TPA: DNA repair exonuclease [Polyangiaceae bacterium]|nr:DNA repair exonuclease [Polyangiaceae bacterium]
MKLVHAADLHVDSPMRGLERYENAPVEQMRGATRRALENLVTLCIDEEVALLLLAGDLYDGDWKDYATGLYFAGQMSRLRHAGVEVAIVWGNHDAESQISRHLQLPDNVTVLPSSEPGSVSYDELGVVVHGQSYAHPAETNDLASGYPEAVVGKLNVGLLHTAATGRAGHLPYAPCDVGTLTSKGYDYWALGHVHAREVLSESPWIVFPGNLQGRHCKENGPKGAMVIDVDDGAIRRGSFRVVDAVRWCLATVDVEEAETPFDVVDLVRQRLESEVRAAEGRPLAVRVVLEGQTPAHGALVDDEEGWINRLRAEANDLGTVWLEQVRLTTEPVIDVAGLSARDDAVGQIARALAELQHDDEGLAPLMAELQDVHKKLPAELRSAGPEGLRLDDPSTVRRLLREAENLVLARLAAKGRDT